MTKENGMVFKIESGIKPPKTRTKYSKYPFAEMKKGDSFLVLENFQAENIRASASYWGIRHPGTKFSVRKDGDGYRCFRIK